MPTAHDLQRLRQYAEAAWREIQAFDAPAVPNIQIDLQRVTAAVEETIQATSTAVKIGLVGEFNAGKTVLLGALLGCGDALPVSATPTTGNITELHFVQHPDEGNVRATEIGPFKIEYLDQQGIADSLAYMLKEAANRAMEAQLPDRRIQELRTLQVGQPGVWEALEGWCRAAWGETTNPRLRNSIRELVWFARCYVACGNSLCGGKGTIYTVEAAVARDGLILAATKNIQHFAELPAAPPRLTQAPLELTAELLRATFPLVRRCQVQVKLSRQIWNLAPLLTGNELILLDFPGLGADTSGVRDQFLCLRELAEVHTILVLLDGQRPGAGDIQKVYDMMQKDRQDIGNCILVGISRFDLLPVSAEQLQALLREFGMDRGGSAGEPAAGEDAIGFLLSDASNTLDEDRVYRELHPLKKVIEGAEAFTPRSDRIVLLSSILALGELAERYPELPIGSELFHRDQLADALPQARRMRDQWRALSQQLQAAGEAAKLTQWLIGFTRDGGLTALRDLLQKHVQEHGLNLIYNQAQKKVAQLDNAIHELCETLKDTGPVTPSPDDPDNRVRAAIRGLLREFNQYKSKFEQDPPNLLQVATPTPKERLPLSDLVQEEVVARIFAWPEWQSLLNLVKDGYLEPPRGIELLLSSEDILTELGGEVPKTGEDFYRSFVDTYQELNGLARQKAQEALDEWLKELANELSNYRAELAQFLNDTVRLRLKERLGKKGEELFTHLNLALRPERLQSNLARLSGLGVETDRGRDDKVCGHIFPLHRERRFGWEAGMMELCPRELRHQVQLLRLRDECINSISRELTEFVSRVNREIVRWLRELFARLGESLMMMNNDKKFIAILAGTEDRSTVSNTASELAGRLQALASPLNPEGV